MAGKKQPKTIALIKKSLEYVKSVPYKVTKRWLFYRLYQDGTLTTKKDISKLKILDKVRKEYEYGWTPDTLADTSRNMHRITTGIITKEDWLENLKCKLDKFQNQDYYIMLWFEANAMLGQFKKYTDNIPLVPFGGDPSIPFKYSIAKEIEWADAIYNKPIVILYFGDCDKKGEQIPKSALEDIEEWCSVDFEFIPCGLTLEQAKAFKLPEDPEKPDKFQWEALSDEQAKKIICNNIKKFQDKKKFKEVEKIEKEILKDIQLNQTGGKNEK